MICGVQHCLCCHVSSPPYSEIFSLLQKKALVHVTDLIGFYYMASSVTGQDEPNPVL